MSSNLLYNREAPRKPVNLSVNNDLVRAAKTEGINLSDIFEEALLNKLRSVREDIWKMENRAGVEAYNDRIEQYGVFAQSAGVFRHKIIITRILSGCSRD